MWPSFRATQLVLLTELHEKTKNTPCASLWAECSSPRSVRLCSGGDAAVAHSHISSPPPCHPHPVGEPISGFCVASACVWREQERAREMMGESVEATGEEEERQRRG
ncbi:unnamed protein product [Pleuronectes platessa]|uniref:Uncharacterized protein n=1 Tax=Pleuronectes platessa TaxID=8262 RepID=A0A9N7YS46_PLEPL|nr:unnamed protein product [Pleuronectes platessa]